MRSDNPVYRTVFDQYRDKYANELPKQGVPPDVIQGFLEWIGIPMPESYLAFISEYDGAELNFGHLEEVIERDTGDGKSAFTHLFELTSSVSPLVKKKLLIPFADDGRGNCFCFDRRKQKQGDYPIVQLDHEDHSIRLIADNFLELIRKDEWVE